VRSHSTAKPSRGESGEIEWTVAGECSGDARLGHAGEPLGQGNVAGQFDRADEILLRRTLYQLVHEIECSLSYQPGRQAVGATLDPAAVDVREVGGIAVAHPPDRLGVDHAGMVRAMAHPHRPTAGDGVEPVSRSRSVQLALVIPDRQHPRVHEQRIQLHGRSSPADLFQEKNASAQPCRPIPD
jgi:hypothetical protein